MSILSKTVLPSCPAEVETALGLLLSVMLTPQR
jgi:hypothetical protein